MSPLIAFETCGLARPADISLKTLYTCPRVSWQISTRTSAPTPAASQCSPRIRRAYHRLIVWKMETRKLQTKNTEGARSQSVHYDLVVGQMFVKNSKQKLWLFVLYSFDPKFLKMAPGTHNAATNQINRSHCVDRTRWWGNAGGIHMRKISYIAGVVAVLVLVGVGTWIGVGKGTSTSAFASSAVNPISMMTSATDLRTSHYDDYSVVFVELQTKR